MRYRGAIAVLFLLALTATCLAYSDGQSLVGYVGGAGESLCTECHGSAGGGSLTLSGIEDFGFDSEFEITLTIDHAGQQKWGFLMIAMDQNDQRAGDFILTDPARTQIFEANNRQYVQHTAQGTDAGTPNTTSWTFHWRAPDHEVGTVTFYAAGVAANNNGTEGGDNTYTTTQAINWTGVNDAWGTPLPAHSTLHPNYPNPFNAGTVISFNLAFPDQVSIDVFNVLGHHVANLSSEWFEQGFHQIAWDGTDATGQSVPSGMYFYRLVTSRFSDAKKMVLLR